MAQNYPESICEITKNIGTFSDFTRKNRIFAA